MSGTGAVSLGGVVLYAYFAGQGDDMGVRVSADEWDRLGLYEGQWVRVALPGQAPQDLLLIAATRHPPLVWITFAAARGRAVRRTG